MCSSSGRRKASGIFLNSVVITNVSDNLGDQGDIFRQLTASIADKVENSKETNKRSGLEYERKLKKYIDKKDNMGKLHSSVQHAYFMAASEDRDKEAADIPE